MKTELLGEIQLLNSGSKEFPYYQILIGKVELCCTGSLPNAKMIIEMLSNVDIEKAPEDKPTDEDIEKWAEKCCEAIPDDTNRVLAEMYRIRGAKAMRDNKIYISPNSKL
jgi:hypothetical protein